MNTSAKMTAFSLLAASALGVAAFVGCTTSSTLSDDTDGGTRDSGGPTGDGGTTGPFTVGSICKTNTQVRAFGTLRCQECIENQCCTQLRGCFNLPGIDAGQEQATCESYSDCTAECQQEATPQAAKDCQDLCDEATPSFVQPYDAITSCAETSCKAECASALVDGG
jgi:hypothetical protein